MNNKPLEKEILKYLSDRGYNWITRDFEKELYAHTYKPVNITSGVWYSDGACYIGDRYDLLSNDLFPSLFTYIKADQSYEITKLLNEYITEKEKEVTDYDK